MVHILRTLQLEHHKQHFFPCSPALSQWQQKCCFVMSCKPQNCKSTLLLLCLLHLSLLHNQVTIVLGTLTQFTLPAEA